MEKNKTAVDFLWTKASSGEHLTPEDFEQAKQMEKDQIKELLEIIMWYDEESDVRPNTEIYNWFKQYYNETYGKE